MAQEKILVVDDETTICEAVRFNLEAEGYQAEVAYNAEEALRKDLSSYDLVLLDVMMSGMDGFTMAKRMKQNPATANVPIIFCTALDNDRHMVDGLDLGADDYIAKPYTLTNLMARVRSVLRRTSNNKTQTAGKEIRVEGIVLDCEMKSCTVDGVTAKMPRKEFEILKMLITNPNRVFTRAEIFKQVWDDDVIVCDRTIDVNITRLRQKLGQYGKRIITRSGYGYGFEI